MHHLRRFALAIALTTLACGTYGRSSEKPDPGPGTVVEQPTKPALSHSKGKALSPAAKAGLAFLVKHQLPSGGWGQGDESNEMGGGQQLRDKANVADTSMALLALLRAGHTTRFGEYQDQVQKGIEYVVSEVEGSDDTSLKVTSVTGTRVQMKIGTHVDTFAALVMLDEARGMMRDAAANDRVDAAIKKIVKKIEHNQREDGGWEGQGWAPVLSQALAAKGLNRAQQTGIAVSQSVLDRVEKAAQGAVRNGQFAADSAAGVELYSGAASSSATREYHMSKKAKVRDLKEKAAKAAKGNEMKSPDKPSKAEIAHAEDEERAASKDADATQAALVARMSDDRFVSGFGSNGGEEFLSYLLVAESLFQKGGDEWTKYDSRITKLVVGVQNGDGSWTGHHCITGRTFCTAAALLLLMADRAPTQAAIAT
jgi:hypothetical protein